MGITNRDGALYFATGIDNTGLYKGKQEAIGIIKSMMSQVTSFDVFGGIGVSAGIAFAQAAKHSYEFSKEYDKNMREVLTISAAVQADFDEYKQKVIDMTTEIPVAATESAKALYQIVSAGHDGADGMKILETSAKAALGGVTDTATAADAITTILNAYKLNASEAEKISDQLFTTVRLGKTTFGELGQSIAQAAPLAAAYGVEIDQVLAAVATLTKSGTPTAQAMTQIRASIVGVSKVLGDGAFATRTYQEALLEVSKRAAGSESQLRTLVPEIEAVNGVLGMTGINAKSAASDLKEMNNSLGATEDAYKRMADSTDAQLQLLSNNVIAYLRPMGEKIMETVSSIAGALNEAFENGDVQETLKQMGELLVTVTGAFIAYKTSIVVGTVAKKIYMAVVKQAVLERKLEQAAIAGGIVLEKAATKGQLRNIAIRKILTTTIKANTAALAKNAAAMLTNPYVLAAAAITALGYSIYKMATYATDAEKAMKRVTEANKEFKSSVSAEQIMIDRLFGKLKATTEGTKEYDKAKKAIISKYGQYLDGLDEEVKSLKKVEEAYKAISEAAIQAARDRAIDSASRKATDEYVKVEQEKLEKIRELMEEKFGALDGTKFFERLVTELEVGKGFSGETQKVIDKFNGINMSINPLDKVKFREKNLVKKYLKDISDTKDVLNTELKKIDTILGNHSPEVELVFNVDTASLEELRGELEKAEAKFKEIDGSLDFDAEAYENQEAYIAKLKETIKVVEEAKKAEEDKAKKSIEQYDAEIKKLKELQAKTTTKQGFKDEKGIYIQGYDDYQKQINELQRGRDAITGKLVKDQQKINDAKKNQVKLAKQLELDIEQARVEAMKEGNEKYAAQRAFALKKDLIAVKEKGEALVKAQQEAEKTAWEEANKGKSDLEKGVFSPKTKSVADLPKEQRELLKEFRNSAYVTFIKNNSDYYEQLHDSLVSQINEYKYKEEILIKDWDKKIAIAISSGNGALAEKLREEKKKALKELEFEEFKKSVDFSSVFGDLDKLSTTALEQLRGKLKEYINVASNSLSPESLKELMDAFRNLDLNIADRKPFGQFKKGFEDYKTSCEEVTRAEEELNRVNKDVNSSDEQRVAALDNLTAAQNKRRESLGTLNKSINSIGEKGQDVVGAGENILGMLEDFGVKVPEALKGTLSGVGQIMDGLASVDITKPFSIATGGIKVLSGLGKTIGSIFGGGKSKSQRDAERLEKVTNKIAQSNNIINSLIDKRISLIQKATAAEKGYLAEITKTSIDVQKAQLEKQFQSLRGNDILAKKGKNNNLSLKELGINSIEELREFLSSDRLLDYLNNKGYSIRDVDKYQTIVDAWTQLEGQAEKLGNTLNESLTGISFDELKDGLDDLLLSADTTMEDISGNFEDYMRKAILNIVKTNTLSKALEGWYENFAQAMKSKNGKLDVNDINKLKKEYENIFTDTQEEIKDLLSIAGLSLDSEKKDGVSGQLQAEMTEETGSRLVGLWNMTALDIRALKDMSLEHFNECKSCFLNVFAILEQTKLIQINTLRTADNTDGLVDELRDGLKGVRDELTEIKKNTKSYSGRG